MGEEWEVAEGRWEAIATPWTSHHRDHRGNIGAGKQDNRGKNGNLRRVKEIRGGRRWWKGMGKAAMVGDGEGRGHAVVETACRRRGPWPGKGMGVAQEERKNQGSHNQEQGGGNQMSPALWQ